MSEQRIPLPDNRPAAGTGKPGGPGSWKRNAFILFLAAVSVLLDLNDLRDFSPAGQVVLLLTIPVLAFGWWQIWRGRRQEVEAMTAIWLIYGLTLWLRETAPVVSDLTLGRPVDRVEAGFSIIVGLLLIAWVVWQWLERRSLRRR